MLQGENLERGGRCAKAPGARKEAVTLQRRLVLRLVDVTTKREPGVLFGVHMSASIGHLV